MDDVKIINNLGMIDSGILLIFGCVIAPTTCLYIIFKIKRGIRYEVIPSIETQNETLYQEAIPLNV